MRLLILNIAQAHKRREGIHALLMQLALSCPPATDITALQAKLMISAPAHHAYVYVRPAVYSRKTSTCTFACLSVGIVWARGLRGKRLGCFVCGGGEASRPLQWNADFCGKLL